MIATTIDAKWRIAQAGNHYRFLAWKNSSQLADDCKKLRHLTKHHPEGCLQELTRMAGEANVGYWRYRRY